VAAGYSGLDAVEPWMNHQGMLRDALAEAEIGTDYFIEQ
jgi:hypothetical protein